jgi:chaperonin GroEL
MTGAKLCESQDLQDLDVESNILFEENFGACRRIRSNELETVLMGVKGDKNQIQDMLSRLEYYSKNENQPGYRSYYQERLSRLQGKSCTIYVGGITPVEITENRDKIVDALNSCQTSLQYGVLPGGGNAFIHGLKILEMLKYESKDLDVGLNIFYHAIINTLKHLLKNSKVLPEIIIDKVKSNENPLFGYDVVTDKYSDNMIEVGVLDSFNTIKTAIEDSVSVASLLITTECVVYKEYDYERKLYKLFLIKLIFKFFIFIAPPLDAFRNRIKTDPEYRAKVQREFHSDGPDDDMKLFSSVI